MTQYRNRLPQLDGGLFLTDGGIETTLIFHENLALPDFAAFDLLRDRVGKSALKNYYAPYLKVARDRQFGFILESATWRASSDWGAKLGYSKEALAAANEEAVEILGELRADYATGPTPMVISGAIGPRGDGYDPGAVMTADEAEAYHSEQIGTFTGTEADMITAITMTNTPEAIGLTRAAQTAGMPVVISFTVETDGRLPTGQSLDEAIESVDQATDAGPAYFMINCAHPDHFEKTLDSNAPWVARIRGVRANASRCSHAELDEATELDEGDPTEFGAQHARLLAKHAQLAVFGGCCGTDHRHIAEVAGACRARIAA